jgi:hypothetical protein
MIPLADVLRIENLEDYKVHFAKWNGQNQPLDVFTKDRQEWQGWQEYRPTRDEFNRPLIFALASFYHEPSTWFFGGIYKVLKRYSDRYQVQLSDIGEGFIGPLKLRSPYNFRAVRVNMEEQYKLFEVAEILREPYTGRPFPGYEDIDISFEEIENLVRFNRIDWKAALESVKGVYLITDTKTGKRYVGSAYGQEGVWARWSCYADTGHGGNVALRALGVKSQDLTYYRAFFRLALLEHRPFRTSDELILQRENFWKQLLLTRGENGLNRN